MPALNMWASRAEYTTARPIATQFLWHGCMNDLQLTVALIRKLRGPLKWLTYFLDMPFMVVSTTRHLQTSGRLVQELNVCTVDAQIKCLPTVVYPGIPTGINAKLYTAPSYD